MRIGREGGGGAGRRTGQKRKGVGHYWQEVELGLERSGET